MAVVTPTKTILMIFLRKKLETLGSSISTLNTLEKNGVISQKRVEISRLSSSNNDIKELKALSISQERALKEIKVSFESKGAWIQSTFTCLVFALARISFK